MANILGSLAWLALAVPALALAEQVTIDFDGADAPISATDFAYRGARWNGGRVATESVPGLQASGAFHYESRAGRFDVRFDAPVTDVRFHYAHGFGFPPGVAVAYDAVGARIASVQSRKATHAASANQSVSFPSGTPIKRIEFDGGVVDHFIYTANAVSDVPVGTHINGAWLVTSHAPSLDGHGLMMEYLPDAELMFVAWFTFDAAGSPVTGSARIGAADQRWLTAQGPVDGALATLAVTSTRGGLFNLPATVQRADAGSMRLRFTACDRATVEFTAPGEAARAFEITRARTVLTGSSGC